MQIDDDDDGEITEEQRRRAEANRLAALAKRKAVKDSQPWALYKCRKLLPEQQRPRPDNGNGSGQNVQEKFLARLEISSPDSFSITPVPVQGFGFPGEDVCFQRLTDRLCNALLSHYTQNTGGGKAGVYSLYDYYSVLKSLKSCQGIECEEIPWSTFNVVERLSHSFSTGKWTPCRPEHLPDEKVDELIAELPKTLLSTLLPYQVEGVRFGLRRGGRCLIADEMGLGKTLQAIAIARCFMKEGSILVVCPAILRYSWAEEFEHWLPSCLPSDIHLVFGRQDNPARLAKCPKVVVTSYAMLRRLRNSMLEQEWATLIVDESHHLHCNKKSSEKDELTSVLDVASKVKRLILLSGTPSLSRPYDIFHQVNVLWPGLLGKTKYEFAETYCAVRFVRGSRGSFFQDFSRGRRLQELHVLLKQSVMIRRLKEHVLLQLPPKRRQIINLVLKKSDISFAMSTLGLESASAITEAENEPLRISDEDEGNMNDKLSEKLAALGLAKLPGFFEWLSIHPVLAKTNGEESMEEGSSSHKMIIFAHHHKVLDGVQAFLCEKGIRFIRIDCTITGSERQLAIQSFQSSREVKIALIGIRAGGSGLNLTAAQNVVFLELPTRPGEFQQAEDRVHRHGQKRPINIYIFCAKDTSDELVWQKLNRSLHRVSSTVNGKHDAVREIEVEDFSFFGSSENTNEKGKLTAGLQNCSTDHNSQLLMEGVEGDKECIKDATTLVSDGDINKGIVDISIRSTNLRFEVSQHTGRIHLYSCNPGDSRPSPLFKNFRQDEVECNPPSEVNEQTGHKPAKDDPYQEALTEFINEWKMLRPIEKRKLINKPLQLPLSCELCYLSERLNHDNGGLLKGKSNRRTTPVVEISHPLPSDAVWRKVNLYGRRDRKDTLYLQAFSKADEPLCKLCQTPCKGDNARLPQFFEDLFCTLDCFEEYRYRTSSRFLREGLFEIERGVCTNCQLDCHRLVRDLRPLSLEQRKDYINRVAPNIAKRDKLLDKLVHGPADGNAWHADHIIPVYKGGGECKLENMRTLCVACHADVTAAQCAERRIARNKARKQLRDAMGRLKKLSGKADNVLKDHNSSNHDNLERDLLIDIPGSAYSEPNIINKLNCENTDEKPQANKSIESFAFRICEENAVPNSS